MTTVVVSGALANKCFNGGEPWTLASWMIGLRRLGFHTVFIENIGRERCRDESGSPAGFRESANLAYFASVTDHFGLSSSSALVCGGGEDTYGMSWQDLLDVTDGAELLVNISGHLRIEPLLRGIRSKAYIDHDPGFTQYWRAKGVADLGLEAHDFHFTVGENIGSSGCPIPTGGFRWRPLRQPVVLEHWPLHDPDQPFRFTTVGSWRSPFGPVEWEGRTFGLRVHEFRKLVELPRRTAATFEIALDIHPADDVDRRRLLELGWCLVDPVEAAGDPERFRGYVGGSGAEFSVAQGVYVETSSGWFSDRTVRYLASGKPALVQETGFSRNYTAGDGLVPFTNLDEAAAGAKTIERDYDHHRQAARQLAEEAFDSDKVLSRLADDLGICP